MAQKQVQSKGSKGPFTENTYNKSQTATVRTGDGQSFGMANVSPARANGGKAPAMKPLRYS